MWECNLSSSCMNDETSEALTMQSVHWSTDVMRHSKPPSLAPCLQPSPLGPSTFCQELPLLILLTVQFFHINCIHIAAPSIKHLVNEDIVHQNLFDMTFEHSQYWHIARKTLKDIHYTLLRIKIRVLRKPCGAIFLSPSVMAQASQYNLSVT